MAADAVKPLDYLLSKEWSMGNGQCPECYGVPESWLGHPCHPDQNSIGHEPNCALASSLKELGHDPLMMPTYVGLDGKTYKMSYVESIRGMDLKDERNEPLNAEQQKFIDHLWLEIVKESPHLAAPT